jgi:hypothetical protein
MAKALPSSTAVVQESGTPWPVAGADTFRHNYRARAREHFGQIRTGKLR